MSTSWKRCPKTSCPAYGKRLTFDAGQDDTGVQGLTVVHRCPDCGYAEHGPSTPAAARRTSPAVIERMLQHRLNGWTLPLEYDTTPFPTGDLAQSTP